MGKFFKWLFLGALIGVGLGLALYALGFVVEIFNCTFACGDPTRKDAIPAMWEKGAFGNVIMYCSIGCCVIGSIYGVASGIQEHNKTKEADRLAREKSALRQRKKNAPELKKALPDYAWEIAKVDGLWCGCIESAYQVAVDILGHERDHRSRRLCYGNESGVKSHIGVYLVLRHSLRPVTFASASYVPVGKLVHKVLKDLCRLGDPVIGKMLVASFYGGVES